MEKGFEEQFEKLVSELSFICPTCNGHGKMFLMENLTRRARARKCPDCHGEGRVEPGTMEVIFRIGFEKYKLVQVTWAAANGMTLVERKPLERRPSDRQPGETERSEGD